jgi:hypothetical protein
MDAKEAQRRIAKARQKMGEWEGVGLPHGNPGDLLHMIVQEITAMEEISLTHPSKAEKAKRLIARYQHMRELVEMQLH